MSGNRIFREELPGEKKTLINLAVTGYLIAASCLGYTAWFLFVQLGQIKKLLGTMDRDFLTTEQFNLIRDRLAGSAEQLSNEMIWLAFIGMIFCAISGTYMFNLLIRPLRQMVDFVESRGKTELPEFKSNHELKQLATAITEWTGEAPSGKRLEAD